MRILLLAFLVAGGAELTAAVKSYREGRFKEALTAFRKAEQDAGNDASAELLHNLALTALQAGELSVAEVAARKCAAIGGPQFEPLRDFLLGNVAYVHCEKATFFALSPEAEPFAVDVAISHGETARDHWQRAATSRPDWPEARRNVERALLLLKALEQKQAELEEQRKKENPAPPQEEEKKEQEEDPDDPRRDAEQDPQKTPPELSEEELRRMLELLESRGEEKRELRQQLRAERASKVEKDW